jgi:hypothetical protein
MHANGGSDDAMPKPAGHAEQPKPSVHAPSAQLRSLQLRHVSCSVHGTALPITICAAVLFKYLIYICLSY